MHRQYLVQQGEVRAPAPSRTIIDGEIVCWVNGKLAFAALQRRNTALVAHHSAAMYEAEQRGLADQLAHWPNEQSAVTDALWMSDMTTGPAGQRYTYPQRLAEILNRYPPGSEVAAAMTAAQPTIDAAIARVTADSAASTILGCGCPRRRGTHVHVRDTECPAGVLELRAVHPAVGNE